MMAEAATCDVCGKSRGEVNHWYLRIPSTVWREPGRPNPLAFVLAEWDDEIAREPGVGHLCGAGCAATALSRALGEKKDEGGL